MPSENTENIKLVFSAGGASKTYDLNLTEGENPINPALFSYEDGQDNRLEPGTRYNVSVKRDDVVLDSTDIETVRDFPLMTVKGNFPRYDSTGEVRLGYNGTKYYFDDECSYLAYYLNDKYDTSDIAHDNIDGKLTKLTGFDQNGEIAKCADILKYGVPTPMTALTDLCYTVEDNAFSALFNEHGEYLHPASITSDDKRETRRIGLGDTHYLLFNAVTDQDFIREVTASMPTSGGRTSSSEADYREAYTSVMIGNDESAETIWHDSKLAPFAENGAGAYNVFTWPVIDLTNDDSYRENVSASGDTDIKVTLGDDACWVSFRDTSAEEDSEKTVTVRIKTNRENTSEFTFPFHTGYRKPVTTYSDEPGISETEIDFSDAPITVSTHADRELIHLYDKVLANADITDTGSDETDTLVLIQYRKTGAEDWTDLCRYPADDSGVSYVENTFEFSGTVGNLEPDTEYEFRTVAANRAGTSAASKTYSTSASAYTNPTLEDDDLSDSSISFDGENLYSNVRFTGTLTNTGDSESCEVGILSSETLDDIMTYSPECVRDRSEDISENETYEGDLSGVDFGTTAYARLYALNDAGLWTLGRVWKIDGPSMSFSGLTVGENAASGYIEISKGTVTEVAEEGPEDAGEPEEGPEEEGPAEEGPEEVPTEE